MRIVRVAIESAAVVGVTYAAIMLIAANIGTYASSMGTLCGVAVAAVIVRSSRRSFAEYGLNKPTARSLALGAIALPGAAFAIFFYIEPILAAWFGPPDLRVFESLRGNTKLLLLMLVVSWIAAAFGEEVIYRGFMLNRIADALGGGTKAWTVAIFAQATVFASFHAYQGLTGAMEIFLFGLVAGALYLACGRSVVPLIIGHGIVATLALIDFYLAGELFR